MTHNQQEGGILGGNVKMVFGRACDSSVPADGREELQSNFNLQVSLV